MVDKQKNCARGGQNRTDYLDFLSVLSGIFVVVLHVSSSNLSEVSKFSLEWHTFVALDSVSRWSVPVFIMISGALFLDRNISVSKLYKKYIFRLAFIWLFWSVVYATQGLALRKYNVISFFLHILVGPSHLWFLPMICGLYVASPVLKQIAVNLWISKYYIWIWTIISTVCFPIMLVCIYFNSSIVFEFNSLYSLYGVFFSIPIFWGYSGYFLLGHMINKGQILIKKSYCYILLIVGAGLTEFLTLLINAGDTNGFVDVFFEYSSMNCLLISVGIFILIKQGIRRRYKVVSILRKYSFGIYLIHPMIIKCLGKVGISTISIPSIFGVLLVATITYAISLLICFVICKIPVLKNCL